MDPLQANEELLSLAARQNREGVLVLDHLGHILAANPAAVAILGTPLDRLIGESLRRFSALSDAEYAGSWAGLRGTGEVVASGPLVRADGTAAQLNFRARLDSDTGRTFVWFHVADERTSDDGIRAAIALRAVLGSAPVVFYAFDRQGIFTYSAGRGLDALGLRPGQLVGSSAREGFGSTEFRSHDGKLLDGREVLDQVLAGRPFVGLSRVGDIYYDNWIEPNVELEGKVVGGLGVAADATERKRLEAKLNVSERLASVGTLAAGVAHELNNPLAYVLSNLQYLREHLCAGRELNLDEKLELARALEETIAGAERMRVIVRDLKALSRMDPEVRLPVSLRKVLEASITTAAHELRGRATVALDIPADLPQALGSEARLGQVFLNLLVNAAQAIGEKSQVPGEIRVSARASDDHSIVVEVRDNGAGIPKECLSRIFDPFFTTKPVGVGTGLGLPITLRIVEQLGGRVDVESTVGVGTTFRIRLPATPSSPSSPSAAPEGAEGSVRRHRVLIIDDDPRFASSLARLLDQETTVLARSRAEAVAALELDPDFDLIACDVMMPEVTGPRLALQLVERWPELESRIVLMTGGAFTPEAIEALETSKFPKLEKPFELAAVRRLLRSRART